PLAVGQPGHVVGGADVDVVRVHLMVEKRRDGLRLRDLLRLEPLPLEHVVEVHVAADVELRGARQLTPRSWNSRASMRCTIVAPTCDLMSSPTIGSPAFSKRRAQ